MGHIMYQLLVYVDIVNLFCDNVGTMKRKTRTVVDDSKEVGLEVNAKKSKLICSHENAGQNHNIKIAKDHENVAKFRYLCSTLTN
jgi:hypothetical protein